MITQTNNDKIRITTDNEWDGKYELLEKQYLEDRISLATLGDNLPTGARKQVGDGSFFKTKMKELGLKPKSQEELYNAMAEIHEKWPVKFMENYGDCNSHIKKGVEFLTNSELPKIQAITGNREYDYQLLLNLLANKAGAPMVDYMNELKSCGKFDLYEQPMAEQVDATSMLWLPYHPKADKIFLQSLEDNLDKLRDFRGERIVIMTHENPCPEAIGASRKAKMQETLDNYISGSRKINSDVTLFCGHLDLSADSVDYNGIIVQPLSGKETAVLDVRSGEYSKFSLVDVGGK